MPEPAFSFFISISPGPQTTKNRALHSLLISALFHLSFNVYLLPAVVELSRIMTLLSSALSSVSHVLSNRVHGFDYGHDAALGLGGKWLFLFFLFFFFSSSFF